MNDEQFFEKIELEPKEKMPHRNRCGRCLDYENYIDQQHNGEGSPCHNCFHIKKIFPEITADHIIALEGLIKWPYSFEVRSNKQDDLYVFRNTQKELWQKFFCSKSRKDALKALISWMIDEKILTKDEAKAVFNA